MGPFALTRYNLYHETLTSSIVFDIDLDFIKATAKPTNRDEFNKHCAMLKLCYGPLTISRNHWSLSPLDAAYYTHVVRQLLASICFDGIAAHPILADALDEAGCVEEIVQHLRQPSHRPDCFAVMRLVTSFPDL